MMDISMHKNLVLIKRNTQPFNSDVITLQGGSLDCFMQTFTKLYGNNVYGPYCCCTENDIYSFLISIFLTSYIVK